MKKTRRFAAIAAAAVMTAALAVPMSMSSFAEETTPITSSVTTTIKVTDGETVSGSYNAYQILTATVNSAAEAYTYHVNPKYEEALKEVTGAEDEAGILAFISGLTSTTGTTAGTEEDGKPTNMRAFADQVYAKIKTMDADKTTTTGTFESVAQGYYLIAQNVEADASTTASLVMVDTAGDTELTVTTKKDLPTFTKEIGDRNDTTDNAISAEWNAGDYTWGIDADHDKFASDAVPFRLTATLPSDYDSYDHYTLNFHDDLQADVFGDATIKAVYVVGADGTKKADIANTAYTKEDGCDATHGAEHGDGCDFTVLIKDLKTAVATATAGDKVVVEYTAPFTADTIVGSAGNWNTGTLEYSNNPYNSGYGNPDNTTNKTPEVDVVAFTYKTIINKVDNQNQPLSGAKFTLEKVLKDGSKVAISTVEPTPDTIFTFEGLDDGNYVLTESETPAGYNPIEPIEFTVTATHSDKALTVLSGAPTVDDAIEFEVTLDATHADLAADVVNESGNKLPSTGGIGTTLFYVVGGTLVAGAGVTLITKKRIKDSNK